MGTEITIGIVPLVLILVGDFLIGMFVGWFKPAMELKALRDKEWHG